MKSCNVVRYKVKPEHKDEFIQVMSKMELMESNLSRKLIQTGDYQFCEIYEWETEEALASAMSNMIKFLDSFRHMLEEVSPELGVTDPVSGPIIIEAGQKKDPTEDDDYYDPRVDHPSH